MTITVINKRIVLTNTCILGPAEEIELLHYFRKHITYYMASKGVDEIVFPLFSLYLDDGVVYSYTHKQKTVPTDWKIHLKSIKVSKHRYKQRQKRIRNQNKNY